MAKTIKRVVRAGSIQGGHAIQADMLFEDGTQKSLRCEAQNAPGLVQALAQAVTGAIAQQKTSPGQLVEVVSPSGASSASLSTLL